MTFWYLVLIAHKKIERNQRTPSVCHAAMTGPGPGHRWSLLLVHEETAARLRYGGQAIVGPYY